MASISSLFAQTSSYETFVTQLVQIEEQKKLLLEEQKKDTEEQKTAVGAISSAITDLEAKITEFTTAENQSFEPFSSSSSNESVVKIDSVSGLSTASTFNITVDRLASNDTALDMVRTGADTDLSALGDGSVTITIGSKTETINVASTKDEGSGPVARTNEEILEAFAAEIASVFGDEAKASVFNTNDTDVQFSMASLESGYDNRIQFSGATGFLSDVVTNTTKLTPENQLDAQFTIDGVTFTRSSNTVTDAVDGLSFTLKGTNTEAEQMTVSRDTDKAKSNIEDFIDAFNELNETIRERTFINAETGNKGPLQKYRTIRNLSNNLRQTAILSASAISAGQIRNFSEFGITFENDGTMKIDDSDLLETVLSERPEEIAAFFADASSPIASIKATAESFTESNGILDAMEDGFDSKIDRLGDLIKKEEDYLIKYEEEQRRIFNELDALLEAGQQQYDQVVNFSYSVAAPQYF